MPTAFRVARVLGEKCEDFQLLLQLWRPEFELVGISLLTNKDVSLIMRGRLCSSCVQSSMLHGSETWPVRKENVVALQ